MIISDLIKFCCIVFELFTYLSDVADQGCKSWLFALINFALLKSEIKKKVLRFNKDCWFLRLKWLYIIAKLRFLHGRPKNGKAKRKILWIDFKTMFIYNNKNDRINKVIFLYMYKQRVVQSKIDLEKVLFLGVIRSVPWCMHGESEDESIKTSVLIVLASLNSFILF